MYLAGILGFILGEAREVVSMGAVQFPAWTSSFVTNSKIRDDNKLAGEEGTGNYGMLHWPDYYFSKLTRI